MYLDLDKIKPSKVRMIFGILMIIFSIPFFILHPLFNGNLLANSLISSFYFIEGIIGLVEGNGKSVASYFGKRYIDITSDAIKIKIKRFDEEESLELKIINAIRITPLNIEFERNGGITRMPLGDLEYTTVRLIKDTVTEFSNKKNIQLSYKKRERIQWDFR